MMALCEHSEPGDAPRLQPHLVNSKSRIRAAALRGLARAKAPEMPSHLRHALSDPTPLVLRQTARIHSSTSEALDESALRAAYSRAASVQTRSALLSMVRLLGKWEGLDFLLCRVPGADDEVFGVIATELDRWAETANSRFTPIAADARELLGNHAMRARELRPTYGWKRITALL
jgi:hypothetical protein